MLVSALWKEKDAKRKFDIFTIAREMTKGTELWSEKADAVGWETWKEKVDLQNVMGACACIFKPNLLDERDRPSTEEVRAARKIIMSAAKDNNNTGSADLARAMNTYPACMEALIVAKKFSMQGLQDESANKVSPEGSTDLSNGLAFEDLGAWLATGNAGQPMTPVAMLPIIEIAKGAVVKFLQAVNDWSPRGLQTAIPQLENEIGDMVELAQVANYLMITFSHKRLATVLDKCSPLPLPPDSLPPDSLQTLEDGPEGQADGVSTAVGSRPPAVLYTRQDADVNCAALTGLVYLLDDFEKDVGGLLGSIGRLVEAVGKRVADFKTKFAGAEDPAKMAKVLGKNKTMICTASDYIESIMELRLQPIDLIGNFRDPISQARGVDANLEVQALCKFSGLHYRGDGGFHMLLESECSVADQNLIDAFTARVDKYTADEGSIVAKTCIENLTTDLVKGIFDESVKVKIVHPSVLQDCEPHTLIDHVLEPNTVQELRAYGGEGHRERDVESGPFQSYACNMCLGALTKFVDSAELPCLGLEARSGDDLSKVQVPVGVADAFLQVFCAARGLAHNAVLLDTKLLKPQVKDIPHEAALGEITDLMRFFSDNILRLEKVVTSSSILKAEGMALVSPVSIGIVREWMHLMSKFGGRCTTKLLEVWAGALTAESEKCRNATPTWEAAFRDEKFVPSVAAKLLKGKAQTTVDANNKLYEFVKMMSLKATALQIVPRLTDHEVTCQAVALSSATLQKVATASLVVEGVDLLTQTSSVGTASMAAEFLTKYRKNARLERVPQAFWIELEGLAEGAGASGSRPDAASEATNSESGKRSAPPVVGPESKRRLKK